MMALVGSSVGFHPEIEPSSLTKMKMLGTELAFFVTLKFAVPLKTIPVGFAPLALLALGGIVTISEVAVPSGLYTVATPAPLSLTQIVLDDERAIPHGLIRFGSTWRATPAMSDCKFVHVKFLALFLRLLLAPAVVVSARVNAVLSVSAVNTSITVLIAERMVFICFPFLLCYQDGRSDA